MDIPAERAQAGAYNHRSVVPAAALVFVASLLTTGIGLSMWRPATYPRVRILPEPAWIQFEDSCGRGVERYWEEGTLFWEHNDFVDAVPCRPVGGQDP